MARVPLMPNAEGRQAAKSAQMFGFHSERVGQISGSAECRQFGRHLPLPPGKGSNPPTVNHFELAGCSGVMAKEAQRC